MYSLQRHYAIEFQYPKNLSLPKYAGYFSIIPNTHLEVFSNFAFPYLKRQMKGSKSCSQHYHGVSAAVHFPTGLLTSFFLKKQTRTYNPETTKSEKSIGAINFFKFNSEQNC